MFLENCVYKKSVFYFCRLALLNIFLSVDTANGSQYSTIRFLLSSLIATMATISINFQQKFAV